MAYDVFTVPEADGTLDLVARLGVAGGYAGNKNKLFDLILGLGGGYTVGRFTMMALAWMVWDAEWGGPAPALQIPSGLSLGPALQAQLWLTDWMSIDLSGARVYRFMGESDDPARNVDHETRFSGALGFGSNIGVTLGASYTDYGIGRALTATLALRWGARV